MNYREKYGKILNKKYEKEIFSFSYFLFFIHKIHGKYVIKDTKPN